MQVTYIAITILAAIANSYAAFLNFVGAESVKVAADQVQVSHKWMIPFGMLLASGALGLLIGFAVPVLGTAAAIGLVLYFSCAVSAHIRVRDSHVAGAASFLGLAVAALIVNLGLPQTVVMTPIQRAASGSDPINMSRNWKHEALCQGVRCHSHSPLSSIAWSPELPEALERRADDGRARMADRTL